MNGNEEKKCLITSDMAISLFICLMQISKRKKRNYKYLTTEDLNKNN